ncbi:MAG: tRNA lysidine(34) synthetase TilS [Gemmatimonadota bacterium]
MTLVTRVGAALDRLSPPGATCLVAVSGGPDSLALLDLLHLSHEQHGRPLVVGHIDHGIAQGSATVADSVERAAAERGIPFHRVRLELGPLASETRARVARRAALEEMATNCGAGVVVLGHHADDQAETVLLRVLRGSGPAGLAGMAGRSGIWVRPLLGVTRRELTHHLRHRGLTGWTDPANSDPRHLRSWLRGSVLPLLRDRLPDLEARLLETARQAAAARAGWDDIPALLPALDLRADSDAISVAAPPLSDYRSGVRHAVLAALGRRFGVPIGRRRLAAIDQLLQGGQGSVSLAARFEAELFDGRLTFRISARPMRQAVQLEAGRLIRVGSAEFKVNEGMATPSDRGGWSAELVSGKYFARAWQRGDRIRPLKGQGSRAVSVLLREARVPAGRRPEWPIVAEVASATIVWVPGICRADACIPEPGTKALHVDCALA